MSLERDRGPDSEYARDLEAFRLVLALAPVVGGHRPRGTAAQMQHLRQLDPVAAKQIAAENEQLR